MSPTVDELVAQLASGVSIGELARQVTMPRGAALLDRCAWVRSFDAGVVELLRDGLPEAAGVGLEQIAAHPDVEPVAGREGRHRFKEAAREAALERLAPNRQVPGELARLSARLAEHFRRTGFELSELEMLIAADPEGARDRLRELYRAADEQFDTARCQALIDLLHARGDLAGWTLIPEHNRLERYLTARLYWRDAYRRSSRFLVPDGSAEVFEELLSPDGPRTVQLFGTGGMGKTMHLQALVARLAVPEPARLACAVVDLDLVQPGNAIRRPWLILVEIAHQLNQQLPEPIFDRFLVQHGKLRAHLLLPHLLADSVPGQLGLDPDEDARLAEDVRRGFLQTIGEEDVGGRSLLVFDTLESATHVDGRHATGDARGLFEEIAMLRERLPLARMVLAGRYDLRQELGDLPALLDPMRDVALHRLGDDEAHRYLRSRRKLRAPAEVLEAAICAAGGAEQEGALPFKLALLADAIAQDPSTTADEIRDLEEPGLIYVIKRVVDRIDDVRLRWLLLFGVIPRLLSRRFVEDVMAPYLEEAVQGTSPDVGRSLAGDPALEAFTTDPGAHVDVDELWRKLARYAASYSWVERVAPDVLRFHPDVVGPLRELVSHDPACLRINADAAAYFESQARADPSSRSRLLREALFHRAALPGADVREDWRTQVDGVETDPDVSVALADEVIALGTAAGALLGPETVAEARVERAVARLRLATAPGASRGGELWDQAREDVEQVERCQSPAGPRLAVAQAALLTHDGEPARAIEVIEDAVDRRPRAQDRLLLRLRHGDALRMLGSRDADDSYRAAMRDARRLGVRPDDVAVLAWKRATALNDRDDLARAIEVCDEVLAEAPVQGAARAALSLTRGEASLRLGEPSSCRRWAKPALDHGGRLAHDARMLIGRAELAAWNAAAALAIAEDALAAASATGSDAAEAGIRLAEARELRGDVRARMLDHAGALEDLEKAGLLWDSISGEGARRAQTTIARIQMRDLGELDHAMLTLTRAEKVTGGHAGEDIAELRLRGAEWAVRSGSGGAEAMVDSALTELAGRSAAPGRRAHAALDGVATLGERAPQRWLDELITWIAEIRPARARLHVLEDLWRAPVLAGRLDADALGRLHRLAAVPWTPQALDRLSPPDRRVTLARLAELARVLGKPREARRLLVRAQASALDEREEAYARLQHALGQLDAEPHALQHPHPHPPPPAAPPPPHHPPGVDLRLELAGDGFAVRAHGPGLSYHREQRGSRLVGLMLRAAGRAGEIDHELAAVVSDPLSLGQELGALLFDGGSVELLHGDVRLSTGGGVLDQIPWELARTGSDGRLVALADGVAHFYRGQPSTAPCAPRADSRPPRVLLVRPLRRDRREHRGNIKTTLVPLDVRYRSAGIQVTVLETVELVALEAALEREPYDVLHVVGSFVDAGGGAAIDISSSTAGTWELRDLEKERLTTTGLALALSRSPEPRPVVILDPPALSRGSGLASQLLLRNAFAAELATIAPTPAIVGAGLVSYRAQDMLYETLVGGLADDVSVGELVDRVRRLGVQEPELDGFGLPATALFTAEPAHRLR